MPVEFLEGIKKPYAHLVKKLGDKMTYMPWMSAVALAEHPAIEPVYNHAGNPFHVVFNSAIVVVRSGEQTVMMPVRKSDGQTATVDEINVAVVNHAIARATAKICAISYGVGLGLWLNGIESPGVFLNELGVRPDSRLNETTPLVRLTEAGYRYVPWVAAWAAARITGQLQCFAVEPEPVRVGETFGLNVAIKGKAGSVRLFYPILGEFLPEDGKASMLPLLDPNVDDFNRSAMRAMTRGVAMLTGYGASVYADEDVEDLNVRPIAKRESTEFRVPATSAQARKASDLHEAAGVGKILDRAISEARTMSEEQRMQTIKRIRERVGGSDEQIIEKVNSFFMRSPGSGGKPLIATQQASLDALDEGDLAKLAAVTG